MRAWVRGLVGGLVAESCIATEATPSTCLGILQHFTGGVYLNFLK